MNTQANIVSQRDFTIIVVNLVLRLLLIQSWSHLSIPKAHRLLLRTCSKSAEDKLENPGLVQHENIENRKHADFYTKQALLSSVLLLPALLLSVLPLVTAFSHLQLCQQDSLHTHQGLPPLLDP